jgi:hypothetical protein
MSYRWRRCIRFLDLRRSVGLVAAVSGPIDKFGNPGPCKGPLPGLV